MHLFHCSLPDHDPVELPPEEAQHAVQVLRLGTGTEVGLVDGNGTRAVAKLEEVTKRRCTARIISRSTEGPERVARIHLALAPTKQMDRIEWFVEKAVEVGVDQITPLITARSERTRLRTDRLHRVAIAAMKQSQRAWLPRVDEPCTLADLLSGVLPEQRYFGWCEGQHSSLMDAYSPQLDALVMIGPEGDFTAEEAALLRHSGARAVGLGKARLRTETAALVACTWMSLAQQR